MFRRKEIGEMIAFNEGRMRMRMALLWEASL
jgi:hypothetical protein